MPVMIGCFKKVDPKKEKDSDEETLLLQEKDIKKGCYSHKSKF